MHIRREAVIFEQPSCWLWGRLAEKGLSTLRRRMAALPLASHFYGRYRLGGTPSERLNMVEKLAAPP